MTWDGEWQCDECGVIGNTEVFPCKCDEAVAAVLRDTCMQCLFTNDDGPCDTCRALRCLASNLRIAAALCRAYQIGWSPQQRDQRGVGESVSIWAPGCHRPAPGWTP